MNHFPVQKRFGKEVLDVREFIRPDTYMLRELIEGLRFRTPEEAWAWIARNIAYPWGDPDRQDLWVLGAFLEPNRPDKPRFSYETDDYWEMPSEVLRDRVADCEGTAFLLVSIIRRLWPTLPVYATVGFFQDYGHVWVSIYNSQNWLLYETTLKQLPKTVPTEGDPYRPLFRFNEKDVIVHRWTVPDRIRDKEKTRKILFTYNAG